MYRWLLFLLIGVSITSCRKEERAFLFEMEYPVDFTINAGSGALISHIYEIQNIATFSDSLFAFHEVDPESITDILPRNAQMVPVFTNIDYAFIRSIDIELYDLVNGTVKRIPAFYREPVPEDTGEIVDLIAESIDLKAFLLQPKINVRIKMRFYNPAPKTVESRIVLKFAVR